MEKIDAHQHFWKYSRDAYKWISQDMEVLQRDYLAADLEPLLKKHDISGTIAVQARQHLDENYFLLQQAQKASFVKGIIGWVDLKSYHLPEVLEPFTSEELFKGFRHAVQDEADSNFLLGMEFLDGVKIMDLFDFTFDLLIKERQMPSAIRFLDKLSGHQRIVLDHIGKPLIKERLTNNWKDSLKAMAEYPNLYVKISGMVTEANWDSWNLDTFKPYLDKVVEAFGVDRIMIGSDWPVCLLAADSYTNVLHIAENYFKNFSVEEQEKIFGGNCREFYGVK